MVDGRRKTMVDGRRKKKSGEEEERDWVIKR
jgi:hypothetical protein